MSEKISLDSSDTDYFNTYIKNTQLQIINNTQLFLEILRIAELCDILELVHANHDL